GRAGVAGVVLGADQRPPRSRRLGARRRKPRRRLHGRRVAAPAGGHHPHTPRRPRARDGGHAMSGMQALARLAANLGSFVDAGVEQVGEEMCPACEGEGAVEALDHERTMPWHWEPTYSEFRCEDCGGTGLAPRVVFTIRPAAPLA